MTSTATLQPGDAVVIIAEAENYLRDHSWHVGDTATVSTTHLPDNYPPEFRMLEPSDHNTGRHIGTRSAPTEAFAPVGRVVAALASVTTVMPAGPQLKVGDQVRFTRESLSFNGRRMVDAETAGTLASIDTTSISRDGRAGPWGRLDNIGGGNDWSARWFPLADLALVRDDQERDDDCPSASCDTEAMLAAEQAERAEAERAALDTLATAQRNAVRSAVEEERERIWQAVWDFDQGCQQGKEEFLEWAGLPTHRPARGATVEVRVTVTLNDIDEASADGIDSERAMANRVQEILSNDGLVEGLESIEASGWDWTND